MDHKSKYIDHVLSNTLVSISKCGESRIVTMPSCQCSSISQELAQAHRSHSVTASQRFRAKWFADLASACGIFFLTHVKVRFFPSCVLPSCSASESSPLIHLLPLHWHHPSHASRLIFIRVFRPAGRKRHDKGHSHAPSRRKRHTRDIRRHPTGRKCHAKGIHRRPAGRKRHGTGSLGEKVSYPKVPRIPPGRVQAPWQGTFTGARPGASRKCGLFLRHG